MAEDKLETLPDPGRPLTKDDLHSNGAVIALGLSVAKHLMTYGVCELYLGPDGRVQIARPGEVSLDALPEDQAIRELQGRGYDEDELVEYLKGRDARQGAA